MESQSPNLLIPRRTEGRLELLLRRYVKNGSKGDLHLGDMGLTELPEMLKYIDVDGDFYCGRNKLTSLKNAPRSITGAFNCYNNRLTSLVGFPKGVMYFEGDGNTTLHSLEGSPEKIEGSFSCSLSGLTTLKGSPKIIGTETKGGSFWCTCNKLEDLEGAPQYVYGSFYCGNNHLRSLKGAPLMVETTFDCKENPVLFTEEQVRMVCDAGKVRV